MNLLDEILTGPLAAELAPMVAIGDDVGVAAALNRRDQPTGKQVEAWRAKKLLITLGRWRAIVSASSSMTAAQAAVDLADDPRMTIDFTDDVAVALLAQLKTAGLLDDGAIAALQALSADTTSRATIVLGHDVTHLEVAHALRAMRGW